LELAGFDTGEKGEEEAEEIERMIEVRRRHVVSRTELQRVLEKTREKIWKLRVRIVPF
jgi:hypothetical protein